MFVKYPLKWIQTLQMKIIKYIVIFTEAFQEAIKSSPATPVTKRVQEQEQNSPLEGAVPPSFYTPINRGSAVSN